MLIPVLKILSAALMLTALPTRATQTGPIFVDRAAEWGLGFVHFNGMSGRLFFSEMMGSGAALVDYDGDGDLDAYLVQGAMLGKNLTVSAASVPPRYPLPLTGRLYRNDLVRTPDGEVIARFVDVTETTGFQALGYGMGVATGDIDNDGWVDLYLTNAGPNQMLRNNGDGTFSDITTASGTVNRRWGVSAAFLDFDRDGWLDLYVSNYVEYGTATDKDCAAESGFRDYCGPLAYGPEPDYLYRNRGDGSFADVSGSAGIGGALGRGLGVVTADFNQDGWLDIYVANDASPNFLWMNQQDGTFVDDAIFAGTAVNEKGQPEASMGVVAGDINGDGTEDLFMTHLTMETNTLYLNEGDALFVDSTRLSGIDQTSWRLTSFGDALFDYDNDGWLDLLVVSGAVRRIDELVAKNDPHPLHQLNQLYRNIGQGRFIDVTEDSGDVFRLSEVSRGVATGDVDNDGDPDVLISNNSGPARLLINEGGSASPWLGVRAVVGDPQRDSIGSAIMIRRGDGSTLWRRLRTDGSYASAQDPRILAGANGESKFGAVEIFWLHEGKTGWQLPPMRRYITVFQTSRGLDQ